MEQSYEVAISGAKTDKRVLERTTRENVDAIIAKRQEIIMGFAIEKPPETLTLAFSEARKSISETLTNAGIPTLEEDIPKVVFVNWIDKKKLEEQLQPFGGASLDDERGSSSVFNGVSMVFVKDDITDLDQANIIFHEMFHSVGSQIIAANERLAKYGRQGFEVFGIKSQYKPWLIEEGVVTYEAARFSESLSEHPLFQKDAEMRRQKAEYLKKRGILKEGRITLDSGMEVEPKYFWLMPKGNSAEDATFGLPGNSGLSGSLFELLLSRYEGVEQEEFLSTVFGARKDPKRIPELAKMFDSKWGKGTYTRLLKCGRTEEAVWEIISDLRDQKR